MYAQRITDEAQLLVLVVDRQLPGRLAGMAITMTEAVHLVSSESAAGGIIQAGAPRKNVRILNEQLTVGPCDADPERHVELRRAWNAQIGDEYTKTFGLDDLHAAVAGDLPVVVWATRAYAELLWLWWILDGLRRMGPYASPTFLVRPTPDDPLETVGGTPPHKSLAAIADAHVISDDELPEGAELWRLYASPDPRGFDKARRRGSSVFPELSDSADLHGAWFPRLEGDRLRLAEYDRCLLENLTNEWLMPRDLLTRAVQTSKWKQMLRTFGSYYIPIWRLHAWASHGVVMLAVRDPDSDNLLEQNVFRLTNRARSLLENGLESVGDAPPVHVGGCRINDPAAPWVRVADDSSWRITAHT